MLYTKNWKQISFYKIFFLNRSKEGIYSQYWYMYVISHESLKLDKF